MFTRPRSNTLTETQIQATALFSGYLYQLERSTLTKSWKRHLFVLGKLDGGAGLALYSYTPLTSSSNSPRLSVDKKDNSSTTTTTTTTTTSNNNNSNAQFRLRGTIELEEGCEARPLSSEETHRENCFMVVTAKGQVKFQAESEDDRTRWLEKLSREFEKAIEGTLDKQKNHLLKKGLIVTWHRSRSHGGPVEVLVRGGVNDQHSATLFIGDIGRVPFVVVDEVIAGNDSDLLKGKFHFNCFVVKLNRNEIATSPASVVGLWEGCNVLEFEAPKQSTRDDLVSALEVQLRSGRVPSQHLQQQQQPTLSSAQTTTTTASPILSPSNSNKTSGMTSPSSTTTTINKTQITSPLISNSTTTSNLSSLSSTTVPPTISSSSTTTNPNSSTTSSSRLRTAESVASRLEDSDSDEEGGIATTTTTGGSTTGGSPNLSHNNNNTSSAGPGGVGEYFKQKVKLGRGFPYSRCISLALKESLQGDHATSILTPFREITPGEATEVLHYTKLELPPTEAEIKAAAEAKKRKPPKPIHFEMSEYAPSAFRELRNRFGVTDAQYLKSLSQLSGDGAVGDGKSGMLFFFTLDRRYVLKTVKTNEMAVLIEHAMLPAYLKHMETNPDSLICRFFGLYRYKMGPKGNAREIFLVCMQNSFDTKLVLHEKYDLKGSTRNRWCTPRFGSVLKDLNFGNSKLYLDDQERLDFLKQAERDTLLFESFNVMDYSLLLGIHKPADDPEKVRRNLLLLGMAAQLEDKPIGGSLPTKGGTRVPLASGRPMPTRWQRDFGGIESFVPENERKPQVYIMCIIDILQAYDFGKKAENLIKSQMNEEKKEISAVNPKTYRQRFLGYLSRIIVGVPAQNAVIMASRNQIKLQLANLRVLSANDGVTSRNTRSQTAGSVSSPSNGLGSSTSGGGGGGGGALPSLGEDEAVEEDEDGSGNKAKYDRSVSVVLDKLNGKSSTISNVQQQQLQDLNKSLENSVTTTTSTTTTTSMNNNKSTTTTTTNTSGNKPTTRTTTMEDEIQAAILEAEQEKRAQGGDLYTEVLDDGTEIIMLPEGGSIQRNPDGTEIRSFPDGTTKQTNVDGTIIFADENGNIISEQLSDGTKVLMGKNANMEEIQENPDGSVIETYRDGSTIQRNKDGSRIEINKDGDQKTVFADGTTVEIFRGGLKRQMNPNGVEITTLPDGTRIQINHKTDANIILTIKPDGTRIQEDRVSGSSILISGDGKKEEHRLADGTIIIKDVIAGYTKQTNVDGSMVETFKDGKQKITPAPSMGSSNSNNSNGGR
jgi:hypothetical protein